MKMNRTENQKRAYIAPSIELFPLEAEGILTASPTPQTIGFGGQIGGKETEEGTLGGSSMFASPGGYAAAKSTTMVESTEW
jgi:hypothetical protein